MNQRLSLFAPPPLRLPCAPAQAATHILDTILSKPTADSIPTLATTITPERGLCMIPSRAIPKFEVKQT
jgi:hypothetical protein